MVRTSCRLMRLGPFLVLLAAPSLRGQSSIRTELPPALDSLRRLYVRAHNEGDVSTLADLYASNATYIGTAGDLTAGRDRIAAGLARELPVTHGFQLSDSVEAGVGGDLAWERGRWSMTLDVPGRPVESWEGWYLIVYERGSDHRWRIRNQVVTRDRSSR